MYTHQRSTSGKSFDACSRIVGKSSRHNQFLQRPFFLYWQGQGFYQWLDLRFLDKRAGVDENDLRIGGIVNEDVPARRRCSIIRDPST